MTSPLASTPRSRLGRHPERGTHDLDDVLAVLDAGFLCHIGYAIDGLPYVTPTAYWREGTELYWHGSSASRMLRTLDRGVDCCFTVAHLDGLVLARSAFAHSLNYRSVMLFGKATPVTDAAVKRRQLERFVERLYPGRAQELRPIAEKELKATTVLSMSIDEGAAKLRSGPPKEAEPGDYEWPVWAGVIPVSTACGRPEADARSDPDLGVPAYLRDLTHLGLGKPVPT